MAHYIAMAGLHGCLPNYSVLCDTKKEALDCIIENFELKKPEQIRLRKDGYLELTPLNEGNGDDYVEVHSCDCHYPEIHTDWT